MVGNSHFDPLLNKSCLLLRRSGLILALSSVVTLLTLSGCTFSEVKPWDRDLLAKQSMQLISDPLETSLDEHIYFSKEASSGGEGLGGGGCGCN